ncbi:branched-chain amino acid ABC transporter permease [Pacificispira sp.]|uniref:branched-chain amino acid ABC transporter permease n=1 Tax=Pacificispira sp. TaxID=2888761 RepID=UPI003BAD40DC
MIATNTNERLLQIAVLAFGLIAPFLFPAYIQQIALLWIMILFALTWDTMGGQMGYNSLGNIFFFGAGMYICAVVQIIVGGYDVGEYTAAFGAIKVDITDTQYFTGLFIGLAAAAVGCVFLSIILGFFFFGLRGPYFAIGTLGIALAAGELIGAWRWVGGGSGISLPLYPGSDIFPGSADEEGLFFYFLCMASAVATFLFFRWLYKTRFGLALNAIRDDEEKAEGMGIHTMRYKTVAWACSSFFLGISGGLHGNIVHFIEPLEVAFPTITFGIFMVAMSLLGGKGTLWGPILGAVLFHVIKEVTWTHLLGWQWVALGLIIIVNVVYFQQGIVGWLMERFPERFGIRVETDATAQGKGGAD